MNQKFTPGPWSIYVPNPSKVLPDQRNDRLIRGPQGEHVAETFQVMADSSVALPADQSIINANLIAAAPEMYEALEGLMRNGCGEFVMDEPGRAPYLRCKHCGAEFAEDVYSHSDDCPFMMAQAALAKATGS